MQINFSFLLVRVSRVPTVRLGSAKEGSFQKCSISGPPEIVFFWFLDTPIQIITLNNFLILDFSPKKRLALGSPKRLVCVPCSFAWKCHLVTKIFPFLYFLLKQIKCPVCPLANANDTVPVINIIGSSVSTWLLKDSAALKAKMWRRTPFFRDF